MSQEISIIAIRRHEIEQQLDRIRSRIAALMEEAKPLEDEIKELDMAGRVVARLTGAEWPPLGEGDAKEPKASATGRPEGIPSTPEMVMTILTEDAGFSDGMTPKDIQDEIAKRWWPDVKSELVGPTIWRMWKQKRLVRTADGRYDLPRENAAPREEKPVGETSVEDTPTGLFNNPEHGRGAGQGGGA